MLAVQGTNLTRRQGLAKTAAAVLLLRVDAAIAGIRIGAVSTAQLIWSGSTSVTIY